MNSEVKPKPLNDDTEGFLFTLSRKKSGVSDLLFFWASDYIFPQPKSFPTKKNSDFVFPYKVFYFSF